MAKIQALEWKPFMQGEVVVKGKKKNKSKFNKDTALKIAGIATIAVSFAHGIPAFASPEAVAVMADTSFQEQIATATKPIKDIIFGFAHEIYFVFMAWGALEALIGKAQQGFTRMKVATGAYILLYWVPTIVDLVNATLPKV